MRGYLILFLAAAERGAAWRHICVNSAVRLPPKADVLPKNPAPDAWVKMEVNGTELCRTPYVTNSIDPKWQHCCALPDEDAFGYVWFSVFDADTMRSEGDYLGSAGMSMLNNTGSVELVLQGSDLPGDLTGRPSLLNVFVSYAPPPPMPPALPPSPAPPPAQRWLCIMEAEGLPQTDFWPKMSYDLLSDTWTKVEIADTPTDKEEWQHFAENFRLKMAKDIHDMASHLKNFGVELFQESTFGMCLTSTVYNSAEPRWQHCCDLSAASEGQMYVIAIFDEDIAYSYSDYLGFASIPVNSADGKHVLPIQSGYTTGSLTVELYNQRTDQGAPAGIPLTNYGVECWDQCGYRGGRCDFCGSMGSCCRDGYGEVGCPVLGWHMDVRMTRPAGSCGGWKHCCVFMDSVERASREGRVAFSGAAGVRWDQSHFHMSSLLAEQPALQVLASSPAASALCFMVLAVVAVGAGAFLYRRHRMSMAHAKATLI